uniref:Glucuronosyltransferase n=1 Tax=Rhabditophanes sp. KR3021 TaxID=114890 RepID=A0AC35TMT6_9BILA
MHFLNYLILASILTLVHNYKILYVVPAFGPSHIKFMGSTCDILAAAGHEVHFFIPALDIGIEKTGTKLCKVLTTEKTSDLNELVSNRDAFQTSLWNKDMLSYTSFMKMVEMLKMNAAVNCKRLFYNDTLTEYMRNQKYDLGLGEAFFYSHFALFKHWRIDRHIAMTAGGIQSSHYKYMGLTFPIAQLPDMSTIATDKEMGFFNRIRNIWSFYLSTQFTENVIDAEQSIIDAKFGGGFYDIRQQFRDSSFLMTNNDNLISYAVGVTSKIVSIGGLSIPSYKKVDPEYDAMLSKSKTTILISFGSVAKSVLMPLKMKESFIKVIKQNPETTFLWKYEQVDDPLLKGIDNLCVLNWTKQSDLLYDSRLNGFITHGGLNSITEAGHTGTPVIVIPLFADQFSNAKIMEKLQVGIYLSKDDAANEEKLAEAVQKLLVKDGELSKNAFRLKQMLANRPYNQTEVFIKHVEFAARFGKLNNLNMEGHDISIFTYALLDIIAFGIVVLLLIVGLIVCTIRKIISYFSSKTVSPIQKKTN